MPLSTKMLSLALNAAALYVGSASAHAGMFIPFLNKKSFFSLTFSACQPKSRLDPGHVGVSHFFRSILALQAPRLTILQL
jgi:hypothetical protein